MNIMFNIKSHTFYLLRYGPDNYTPHYNFYKCRICEIDVFITVDQSKFFNSIIKRWDDINNLISCEDYIIKSIIE